MNITVTGTGYVGLSLACLLAQTNNVIALDIIQNKVDLINDGISPIKDPLIEAALSSKKLNLLATTDKTIAYANPDLIVIATPTNYDDETGAFDTASIETCLDDVSGLCASATVAIKSTIPVGYTSKISALYPQLRIIFSPEFLREGHALEDNLRPSRIISGYPDQHPELEEQALDFAQLLATAAERKDTPIRITTSTEAEAVKLFSNTYLALRVAYFNELDTYAESTGLDSKRIIEGVCLDPRIGDGYNNPSFGYGGYCLPKDTKQLLANYQGIPQHLIKATVESNSTRKSFIASKIIERAPKRVGIYRLTMKSGSDNFRQSSIFDVIGHLKKAGIIPLIFEPLLDSDTIGGCPVTSSLKEFASACDLIVANRVTNELEPFADRVYTRDFFLRD